MWTLFRRDLRAATRTPLALVLLVSMVLIPMLFAVFNVAASWDPFSNTGHLKIAVASEDEGFESDLFPLPLNMGDTVLSQLRDNDKMDWTVTTTADAVEGTTSGAYYAAIVLPPTFSADLLSFSNEHNSGTHQARIALYTNEKKNALASTITTKGAEGVATQVTQSFTETVGDVSLELVSSLESYLHSGDTTAAFDRIAARADGVQRQLQSGASTANSLAGILEATVPLVESATGILSTDGLGADGVDTDGVGTGGLGSDQLSTDELSAALRATATSLETVRDKVGALYATATRSSAQRQATLENLARQVEGSAAAYDTLRAAIAGVPAASRATTQLDEAIASQRALARALRQAATAGADSPPDLSGIGKAQQALSQARDSGLRESLSQLRSSLAQVRADVQLAEAPTQLDPSTVAQAASSMRQVAQNLATEANRLGELQTRITEARNGGDLDKLASIVGDNPQLVAHAIAAPVDVNRQVVYPVASFGVSMAPLYTALALWMGAVLCTLFFRPRHTLELALARAYGPIARYFGRYGIFALVGIAQALCVSFGLLALVRIHPVHPVLFTLAAVLTAVVFTLMTYTFVVSLGNAGKAVSVLLLVFQITASGGSYPLEMLPGWFQSLSPWLPATYSITAFRAAIAGTNGTAGSAEAFLGDYWLALGGLLLFVLPMLLMGVVLHRPFSKVAAGMTTTAAKTKVM